jgi:hypothetical protein
LSSPHPVSFILPSSLKNIDGFVYIITITINIYINIDIYNEFWNISKMAIINNLKYMLFIKIG